MTVSVLLQKLGEAIPQTDEETCPVYMHIGPDMFPVNEVSVSGEGHNLCITLRGGEGTFD